MDNPFVFLQDDRKEESIENCDVKIPPSVTAVASGVSNTPSNRATSQTRQEGYEPTMEISTSYPEKEDLEIKQQKTNNTVHRRSRSKAIKKVVHHGESAAIENTKALNKLFKKPEERASENIESQSLINANLTSPNISYHTSKEESPLGEDRENESNAILSNVLEEEIKIENDVNKSTENVKSKVKKLKTREAEEPIEEVGRKETLSVNQEQSVIKSKENAVDERKENEDKSTSFQQLKVKKQKAELPEKEQPENSMPFGMKLKKTETTKIKIKETKLELPTLMHHEFENVPKDVTDEQVTKVKLSNEIENIEAEFKGKKTQKKTKLKKIKPKALTDSKEPLEAQEDDFSNEDLKDCEDETKPTASEQSSSFDSNNSPLHVENDTKVPPEKVDTEQVPIEKCQQSENKEYKEKCMDQEISSSEEPLKDSAKKGYQRQRRPNLAEPKPKDEQAEESLPFARKLRKTETTKIKIKESKLELPKLKHHDFENVPKDIDEEQITNVKLTKRLDNYENDKTAMKKQKSKPKKGKPKDFDEEVQNPMEETDECLVESSVPNVPAEPLEQKMENTLPDTQMVTPRVEESAPSIKKKVNKKQNTVDENQPFEIKLKKSKPNKRIPDEIKMEKVQLKHHDFENQPLDAGPEQTSSVILGNPLNKDKDIPLQKQDKKKIKRKPKIPTEVNQSEPSDDDELSEIIQDIPKEIAVPKKSVSHEKPVKTPKEVGFSPTEEVALRKERDPIVPPAAAISKKHSDIEKVELPAYLNYPSDQGIIMSSDNAVETNEKSGLPAQIAETSHEEVDSKNPVIESQVIMRTSKKIRKVPKSKDKTVEIPIVVESTPDTAESVPIETVTDGQVSLLLLLFNKQQPFCYSQ